jgi:hypothetical protein|tara:strand:- start:17514 stop:22643 length:5130 start_codon:yes stop_codon:yes gene_type:complete
MSNFQVKPNTFYKKNVIDLGVNVTPAFPDFSQSTETTFELSDGTPKQSAFILSGTVSSQPEYGAGELRGGLLRLYNSAIDVSYNRALPNLAAYSLDKTTTVAEGGFSFAVNDDVSPERTVGQYTSFYNSKPHSDLPQLQENFEGQPDGLLSVNRMGGNNIVSMTGPYITELTLDRLLRRDGHKVTAKRISNMAKLCGNRELVGSRQVMQADGFTRPEPVYEYTGEYDIEFINGNVSRFKFVNNNIGNNPFHMVRLDVTAHRYATENHDININLVKFRDTSTAQSSTEGNPEANHRNTILSDFYATRNFSNPFDTTTDDPMIISDVQLTTENALDGGQSLRMYHNWGWASGNANQLLQNQLDVSGNLNAQCSRFSLYDIPFPAIAQDVGASTFQNGTVSYGDARAVLPEIRMAMNVTKLAPNIVLNVSGAADNAFGDTNPIKNVAKQNITGTPVNFSDRENTFLRSVTVTFSNYKPKAQHTTLDKFLNYGLDNYYGTTDSLSDNIVGGFTITRYGINGDVGTNQTSQNMFAYPLPVQQINQVSGAGTPARNDYTLAEGGMGRVLSGDSEGEQAGMLADPDILVWGEPDATTVLNEELRYCELPMNSWFTMRAFTDVFAYNNSGSSCKNLYAAPDSPDNPTAAIAKRGVPMRVIFDTGSPNEQVTVSQYGGSGNPILVSGGSRVDTDTKNLPFLDIFFPAGLNDNSEYTWYENPELYPRHMTVWVQNYCWVSGSDDSNASIWKYNDYKLLPEGASREAEVFIDNIELHNFEPDIKNVALNDSLYFEPQSHYSPVGLTTSGSIYGHGWVSGEPQTLTGSILTTSGSPDATIVDDQYFDVTWLDNHGRVNMAGGAGGAIGTSDENRIDTITGRLTFEMTGNAGSTGQQDGIVFTASTGSLQPTTNRANLWSYDGGQNVCLGLDDTGDLPTHNGTSGYTGYFLANDFNTDAWNEVTGNVLLPRKAEGQPANASGAVFSRGYTAADMPAQYATILGGNLFVNGPGHYTVGGTDVNNVSGAAFDVTNANTVGGDEINLGGGTTNDFFSCDGFRQKGFIGFNISGSGTISSGSSRAKLSWERRENVLTSTKIIGMSEIIQTNNYQGLPELMMTTGSTLNKNQIRVRNPRVFNFNNPNERYVIYLMGGKSLAPTTAASTTHLRKGNLRLAGPPQGDVVTFTQDIFKASDASTPLMIERNFHRLYVSPQKYWVSMLFDSDENNTMRSYQNFCGIQEIPSQSGTPAAISGSTYAQSTYQYDFTKVGDGGQSAPYDTEWDLIPSENNSTLITSVDNGFGALDAESGEGGYVIYGPMYPDSYNIYPFSPITSNYKPEDGAPMVLYMQPEAGEERTATFFSDDYTTDTNKVPMMFWEFYDSAPELSNLQVNPLIDLTQPDINLYDLTTEDLNANTLTWEEENADDIWYRYAIISSKPILDKYHNSTMWLPLNESSSNFSSAPSYTVYKPSANTSAAATVGSDVRPVLEGQGGYAAQLSTTTNGKITIPTATNTGLDALDEFSLVIHWTPSVADKGVKRYIATQAGAYGTPANNFFLYKDTDDTIHCDLGTDIALTSSTAVSCNAEIPTNIIFTFDSGSKKSNKAHLYINGALEDSSLGDDKATGTQDFVLGGFYAASTYTGSTGVFEEVIIYNQALDVLNNTGEYIISTADIKDFSGTGDDSTNEINLTHNVRVFAADYHNFRGFKPSEQAVSNQASWRTTTV